MYGGMGSTGYKIKYTLKDIGTIQIKETAEYPEHFPARSLVDKTIRRIKVIRKIFKELEEGILHDLYEYYKDNLLEQFCDAPTYTIEVFYDGGYSESYSKIFPNKYVEKIDDLLQTIEVDDSSLYGYRVEYLVRSVHTLDQKYIKTHFYNTREKAIRAYCDDAEKYVVMGIMNLYHADLYTFNLFNNKKVSGERIVDNVQKFWDEYYERQRNKY